MSLSKGLVGHWRLDKESFNPDTKRFTDLSAYSNHGTGYGTKLGSADPGFVADRMGQLERACPFGGVDDYIDCGSLGGFKTASIWIKLGTRSGFDFYIGHDSFRLFADSSGILKLGDGSGNLAISSINIDDYIGIWSHIIGISNGTNSKLYFNDVDVTVSSDLLDVVPDNPFNIGRWVGGINYVYSDMAEVYLWNRGLSSQERTLLYESYRV